MFYFGLTKVIRFPKHIEIRWQFSAKKGVKSVEKTHGTVEAVPRIDSFKRKRGTFPLANGYGAGQRFFRCPRCGERARFLYRTAAGDLCRRCAGLNYRSQQATRRAADTWHRAAKYARRHFAAEVPQGERFRSYVPPKPKGMHRKTYLKRLAQYQRYQVRALLACINRPQT